MAKYEEPSDTIYTVPRTGFSASGSFTPLATGYGAGDIMDTSKEILVVGHNGVVPPSGSVFRILSGTMRIPISAVPPGMAGFTLHLYTATPPSAQLDNELWTLAAADWPYYIGPILLGTPATLGGALFVNTQYIDRDIKLVGSSMWGRLVTNAAHTVVGTNQRLVDLVLAQI